MTTIMTSEWSVGDTGFVAIELFRRADTERLISALTQLLNSPPEGTPKTTTAVSPRKTASTVTLTWWKLNSVQVGQIFSEDAKRFQVNLESLLPLYQSIQVTIIDNPVVPFVQLAIRVGLNGDQISGSEIIQRLRQLSIPFRLFVERLGGFSTELSPMSSPRVPVVSWMVLKVDENRVQRLRKNVSELLEQLRSGSVTIENLRSKVEQIRQDEPPGISDKTFNLSSHILGFTNIHVIVTPTDRGGLAAGLFGTPLIVYLTSEPSFVQMPEGLRATFMFVLSQNIYWSPVSGESAVMWLLSLDLWASHSLKIAASLDQRALASRKSVSLGSSSKEIAGLLSDASLLGTDVATSLGEVNTLRRRASSFLDKAISGVPLALEVPLWATERPPEDPATRWDRGIIGNLASMTKDALDQSGEQLHQIEGEVAIFQRHVSDIATLQTREASSRLDRRIARLTRILVVLTGALVLLTAVLAWESFVHP